MKHDYRMNWTLPALPLGPAIKNQLRTPSDMREWELRYFERQGEYCLVDGYLKSITEEDCKQINAADQAPRSESVRSDILPSTTPEAAPPLKNGDRVRVLRCDCAEPAEFIGRVGVVYDLAEEVMGEGCLFYIDFGNREQWCWNASEVELA